MTMLSKSAEIVQKALVEKGLEFKVVELAASARTAQEAALALGCEVGQIVKSLLFCTKQTQRPILVLASGKNRVSEKAIHQYVGEKIEKADANFTRNITGFAIGGIPPLGHKNPSSLIFIDEDLIHYTTLWAAAGTPHAVFSLSASELQAATGGQVVALKELL